MASVGAIFKALQGNLVFCDLHNPSSGRLPSLLGIITWIGLIYKNKFLTKQLDIICYRSSKICSVSFFFFS